jgi:hypothetical protein
MKAPYIQLFASKSPNWDKCREAPGAILQLMNASMPFCGLVSKCNTVLWRLMYRQPLSQIKREEPKQYSPPAAALNLRKRTDVLRCLLVSMSRSEFSSTVSRFDEKAGDIVHEASVPGFSRFPCIEDQRKSPDILVRDWSSSGISLD